MDTTHPLLDGLVAYWPLGEPKIDKALAGVLIDPVGGNHLYFDPEPDHIVAPHWPESREQNSSN